MTDLDLATVLSAHKAGNLLEAEQGYLRILACDPQNGEAYHWLGVIASQKGAPDLALELMSAARGIRPNDPLLLNNLANVLSQLGQMEEAVRAFDGLLEGVFAFPEAHYNRALILVKLNRSQEAEKGFRQAIALRTDYADAHYNLARLLEKDGQLEQAAFHLRRYLEIEPSDRFGAALRLATMGLANIPDRAAFGFVQALFDDYAGTFDDHLTDRLHYSAPELIAQTLADYWSQLPHKPVAVDIGCGTGLAGAPLRSRLSKLDGVDASSKMIAKARERGIYDDLSVVDLLAWSESGGADYHLAVAADVVVYFGDLAPLFAGIARRLIKGGLFAFTAERTAEKPISLQGNFRYAHTPRYLHESLTASGFSVLAVQDASTRQEEDQPAPGILAIARRA